MKMQVYALFDVKAGAYLLPFFTPRFELAARALTSGVADPNQDIGRWPEDYTLFHLGEYDDSTGRINFFAENRSLGQLTQFRKEPPAPTGRVIDYIGGAPGGPLKRTTEVVLPLGNNNDDEGRN